MGERVYKEQIVGTREGKGREVCGMGVRARIELRGRLI